MKELKKVNKIESDFDLMNLNGEVCPLLGYCGGLECGCRSDSGGNTSINDNDEIIF
jgi:hypothetical protein